MVDGLTQSTFATVVAWLVPSLLVAAATNPAAQNATPASPIGVGIVMGESKPLPVYDAASHQTKLTRPRRWCGAARSPEPLLREAIEIASGRSQVSGLEGMRRIHQIPIVPADKIALTRDETICERAAKTYDRIAYSGSALLSEHVRVQPVLVIRLGDRWLVEEARPRGEVWEVMFFDTTWTHLGFGYGAGS